MNELNKVIKDIIELTKTKDEIDKKLIKLEVEKAFYLGRIPIKRLRVIYRRLKNKK